MRGSILQPGTHARGRGLGDRSTQVTCGLSATQVWNGGMELQTSRKDVIIVVGLSKKKKKSMSVPL